MGIVVRILQRKTADVWTVLSAKGNGELANGLTYGKLSTAFVSRRANCFTQRKSVADLLKVGIVVKVVFQKEMDLCNGGVAVKFYRDKRFQSY